MERFKKIFFVSFLSITLLVPGVFSEETSSVLEAREKPLQLSLDEASRLALINSFDIQLAKYDAKIAGTKNLSARSIYDTFLDAEFSYHNDQSKPVSTLLGTKTVDNDYNVTLSKKLPIGVTVKSGITNNRHWTNSSFVSLNPSYDSAVDVSIEQDLGRNFFGIQDRGSVKITKLDVENSRYSSIDRIEASLGDVQRAYWDLVLADEFLRISQGMIEQAKKLYDLHQEKLKNGLIELPEAIASEANYKARLSELSVAENSARIKSNVLKLLLNLSDETIYFMPVENLLLPERKETPEDSLRLAFENRRDYKATANQLKAKNINLSMKKNNLWPEINVKASFARNGIGGDFKDAIDQISDEDNPELLTSLIFSFPLENSKARAEFQSSQFEKGKAVIEAKLLERKIMIGVMDGVRTCNIFLERAKNRQDIARLQEQKFQEEQKRFERGRSSTDTIIRYQEDLLQAKWQAAEAAFDYRSAAIDLRKAEGVLLNPYWEGEI